MSDIHFSENGNDMDSNTSSKNIPLDAMALQSPEVMLSWKDITYQVPSGPRGQTTCRTILHRISGEVRAGETVALIGSSGAGKTTLLNALSGRIVGGQLSGSIQYCGAKRHPSSFKRVTSFVQQDDMMHPLLTVEETLMYASKLRLANGLHSEQDKIERVNTVIRQLRLEATRQTRIGSEKLRGVSGGERKRVSIGMELLTDPHLLFLDEPTSGLDSNSSELVVELVKSISQEQGIATLMTIHQPNAHIFNTFDKVMLLSQGSVVYFGPTSAAISYFAALGYQCPMHENPADYFVKLMTLDYRSEEALNKSKHQVQELVNAFEEHASKHTEKSPELPGGGSTVGGNSMVKLDLPRNSWFYEYLTLSRRDWVNIRRNTNYCTSQVFQPLVLGIIIGFMFYYLGHDALSIQNRLGVLYIILVQASMAIFFPPLALFNEELQILARERSVAAYRVTAYYVSKTTTFIPIALCCNTLFYIVVYFISRLALDAGKFFIGLGIFYIVNVVFLSLVLLVASAIPAIEVAYTGASAILTLQLLFGGFFVNFQSVTRVLKWIRWANPIYYSFSALAQNELHEMEFTCQPGQQCFEHGKQVLEYYTLDRFSIGGNIGLLLLLGAIFYATGYAFLRWKAKPNYIWI